MVLAIRLLLLFPLAIPSFLSVLLVARDLVWIRYGCDDQGVVRKLFLPSDADEHVLYAASEEDIYGLVNRNRLKRLDAALHYMEPVVSRQNHHDGKTQRIGNSKRLRCLKENYEKEKNDLQSNALSGPEVSAKKIATLRMKRYQDNEQLRTQLFEQLRTVYAEKQAKEKTKKPRVVKESASLLHFDPQCGISLFGGDVFAAGANMIQRQVLHSMMKDIRKQRREWKSRKQKSALSKSEITKRLKSVDGKAKELVTVVVKEKEGENGLIEVSLVDQVEKRRNRRENESTKRVRARCCVRKDPCPYVPMTQSQYRILKKLYTNDLWETKEVRTVLSVSERESLLKELQDLLPPKTETVVHTMMTDMMCEKTAKKVENKAKGAGMSVHEVLQSIMMMSRRSGGVIR